MKVHIPTPLRSYTDGEAEATAHGSTIAELLEDLDLRHPGIRFRVVDEQGRLRPHMRVFVNRAIERDLDLAVAESDEVVLMQSLSGG